MGGVNFIRQLGLYNKDLEVRKDEDATEYGGWWNKTLRENDSEYTALRAAKNRQWRLEERGGAGASRKKSSTGSLANPDTGYKYTPNDTPVQKPKPEVYDYNKLHRDLIGSMGNKAKYDAKLKEYAENTDINTDQMFWNGDKNNRTFRSAVKHTGVGGNISGYRGLNHNRLLYERRQAEARQKKQAASDRDASVEESWAAASARTNKRRRDQASRSQSTKRAGRRSSLLGGK